MLCRWWWWTDLDRRLEKESRYANCSGTEVREREKVSEDNMVKRVMCCIYSRALCPGQEEQLDGTAPEIQCRPSKGLLVG